MRRNALIFLALFGLVVLVPIRAQSVRPASKPVARTATPGLVVARLLTFDRNHDGRIERSELPERMQTLLARNASPDAGGALDARTILRLAAHPAAQDAVQGIQPGHYGFGDEDNLDTRLHINGAIDDLRLAKAKQDEAQGIGKRFMDVRDEQANRVLIASVRPLLTAEQLRQFTDTLTKRPFRVAPAVIVPPHAAFAPGKTFKMLGDRPPLLRGNELVRLVSTFGLGADARRRVHAALQVYSGHERLTDATRVALLDQMRRVLTPQERDDLRAALERRPIVKQQGVPMAAVRVTTTPLSRFIDTPSKVALPPQFGVTSLVLR